VARYGYRALPGSVDRIVEVACMMRPLFADWPVYLCEQPIDFRKGIASLAVLVESHWFFNSFSEAFFVSAYRHQNSVLGA